MCGIHFILKPDVLGPPTWARAGVEPCHFQFIFKSNVFAMMNAFKSNDMLHVWISLPVTQPSTKHPNEPWTSWFIIIVFLWWNGKAEYSKQSPCFRPIIVYHYRKTKQCVRNIRNNNNNFIHYLAAAMSYNFIMSKVCLLNVAVETNEHMHMIRRNIVLYLQYLVRICMRVACGTVGLATRTKQHLFMCRWIFICCDDGARCWRVD